jgi:hypothetical protein
MPLYGDILRANFFDLKNVMNCQINGILEPLKDFGIHFFGSYHPLTDLNISLKMIKQWGDRWKPPKPLFKFLAGVSCRHHIQSFVLMKTTV